MNVNKQDIALFPLPVVLFPGCRMPLQIFEPRYLKLVKDSLTSSTPFAIVTLKGDPSEQVVSQAQLDSPTLPDFLPIGVRVNIVDFSERPNGLLGITVEALDLIEVEASYFGEGALVRAQFNDYCVEKLAQPVLVPDEFLSLVDMMQALAAHPYSAQRGYRESDGIDWSEDADRLATHLAYLLPVPLLDRYQLLLETQPLHRLAKIESLLSQLSGEQQDIGQ